MFNLNELILMNVLPPVLLRLRDPNTKSPYHIFVFGMTGSGKTNSVKHIISSKRIKRSLLILDWAGEYGDINLLSLTPSDLSMESLEPTQIVDAFSAAYQLTRPQEAFMLRCLGSSCRISELIDRISHAPLRSASEAELREALLRRLEPLQSLMLFEGGQDLAALLEGKVRLDLSSLPFEARRLAVNIILRLIYNRVTSRGSHGLILVLEEAENVIPPRRFEDPPQGGEVIINELRKWGVSVIAIAQLPSQVSMFSFRNCEYIILHRVQLTALEADWLGLTPNDVIKLAKLPTGQALLIHRGLKRWIKIAPFKASSSRIEGNRLLTYHKFSSSKTDEVGQVSVRSPKSDDDRLSIIEGKLELLHEKLDEVTGHFKLFGELIHLLPYLEASKKGDYIVIGSKRYLSPEEEQVVIRLLSTAGIVDSALINGRRYWVVKPKHSGAC